MDLDHDRVDDGLICHGGGAGGGPACMLVELGVWGCEVVLSGRDLELVALAEIGGGRYVLARTARGEVALRFDGTGYVAEPVPGR